MLSVRELAQLVDRLWKRRSQKVEEVAPELRSDFRPGYTNALLAFGRMFGITWNGDEQCEIKPPTRASAKVDSAALAAVIARLREDLRDEERLDGKQLVEDQAPGYFRGYRQALDDVGREVGLGPGE